MQILVQALLKDRSEFSRKGRLDLLSADLLSHSLLVLFCLSCCHLLFACLETCYFYYYSMSKSATVSHIGPMLYMGSEEGYKVML